MNAIASVIKPGLMTTVQDAGRPGARQFGVPLSGAADRLSFAFANRAVGNRWDSPALECTLLGPTLEFSASVLFAIGGADMDAHLNEKPVTHYEPIEATPGDRLSLKRASIGARSYIAIAGGLAGDKFLGSVATYLPAQIGGVKGRALREGDIIASLAIGETPKDIPTYAQPTIAHDWILRATHGPESSALEVRALADFFTNAFTADKRCDRMGLRLIGQHMSATLPAPMKSSPVFPGTVQCPPDGAPFLLLADAQTVGGYPRIA